MWQCSIISVGYYASLKSGELAAGDLLGVRVHLSPCPGNALVATVDNADAISCIYAGASGLGVVNLAHLPPKPNLPTSSPHFSLRLPHSTPCAGFYLLQQACIVPPVHTDRLWPPTNSLRSMLSQIIGRFYGAFAAAGIGRMHILPALPLVRIGD